MAFVTQDDVFAAIEPVLAGVFEEFGGEKQEAGKGFIAGGTPENPGA